MIQARHRRTSFSCPGETLVHSSTIEFSLDPTSTSTGTACLSSPPRGEGKAHLAPLTGRTLPISHVQLIHLRTGQGPRHSVVEVGVVTRSLEFETDGQPRLPGLAMQRTLSVGRWNLGGIRHTLCPYPPHPAHQDLGCWRTGMEVVGLSAWS